jgi:hypothetical protein
MMSILPHSRRPNPFVTAHQSSRPGRFLRSAGTLAACAVAAMTATPALAQWTRLTHDIPLPAGILGVQMNLLSDGSVMVQEYAGAAWHRLRPDSTGSYHNGTWDNPAPPPMANTRKFFSTCLLRDGRLFAAGGEYGSGNAPSNAEIFDPQANGGAGQWTNTAPIPTNLMDPTTNPPEGFYDAECMLLPNGDVILGPVRPHPGVGTLIYHPAYDSWSAGGTPLSNQDECSWCKLPDGSILTIDNSAFTSERYIPATNTWISDAAVPVQMYQTFETGTGMMMPNGKAFFVGGQGNTALYTPSGTTAPGTWVAGPAIPSGLFMGDAPSANLVTGNMLACVSSIVFNGGEGPPCYFYEYRPTTNTWSPIISVPTGGTVENIYADHITMLDLPNGQVLYTHGTPDIWEYTPTGSTIAAGTPTILSVSNNPDGSFHIIGQGLNGLSNGASYGDDYQMDTNFPLVRLTTGSTVRYCRTLNWSNTDVQTGNQVVSTEFTVPAGLPAGAYALEVVVNGFASAPFLFHYGNATTPLVTGGAAIVSDNIGAGNDNGNGRIDPGENAISLYVPVENLSFTANVTNVNGTLSTTDPYVTITSANAFYNDLGPLATSNNLNAFTISVSRFRACGTPIPFTLVARGSDAFGTITFSVPTGPCTPPADAPANDACAGATTAVEGVTYFGNNSLATTDGSNTCGGNSTQDVWFRYVAANTGTVNINTCGSGYDTVLSVHSACPGTGANQIACNDDNANAAYGGNNACGGGLQSGLDLAVSAGSTYYIRLAGFNTASGNYQFRILPYTPTNATCPGAIAITPGTYTGSTGFAGTEGSSICGNTGAAPDVWYTFTPVNNGTARLDTCSSTYDTVLSVHTGCPGTAANQIACSDDALPFTPCAGTVQSTVDVAVLAGHTYTVRVSGYGGASGAFTLHYNQDNLPNETCPTATPINLGTYGFINTGATTDGPTEANCNFCCGDLQVNSDVWFSIVAPCARPIIIDTLGSAFDTKLAVYAGCPTANNTAVVCNDDFNFSQQSSVNLSPVAGTTYYIRVGGYSTSVGLGTLHVRSCAADFNCDGSITVQDIFAFLNAWFASDPRADFNNAGGVSVQDIFDYLTAWFAGC